jgi:hypothetical protein
MPYLMVQLVRPDKNGQRGTAKFGGGGGLKTLGRHV